MARIPKKLVFTTIYGSTVFGLAIVIIITSGLSTRNSHGTQKKSYQKIFEEKQPPSNHHQETKVSMRSLIRTKHGQSKNSYSSEHKWSQTKDDSSPDTNTVGLKSNQLIKERFDERMAHVLTTCKRSNYSAIRSVQIWDTIAFGRLKYCSIPKSGTTFMNRDLNPTLNKLDDGSPYPRDKPKRFFLVREPYSRIVSAYFSKFVGHPYWWSFARNIIKQFRPNAFNGTTKCGKDVTFPEYIKFVNDIHKGGKGRNVHFLRQMEVCNVCVDIPDFIAKLETVRDDVKYILQTVNVTGDTGKSFVEVGHLAKLFVNTLKEPLKNNCGSMCSMLNRFWYGQQATGLISEDIELPVKGQECQNITGEKLAVLAITAYNQSVGRINKHEHKRKVMTQLFRQVPMKDRKELQEILSLECELFGYDPQPDFVFPELAKD